MKRSRADLIFDICNIAFMVVILIVMIYPLYFVLIASVSDPYYVASGKLTLWPKAFTLDPYINVFRSKTIWTGYLNSVIYTSLGTFFNLVLTIPTAYALSKKKLHGRSAISWFFLFTMFFGGGLIPFYLLVRDLSLIDKPYTLIVLGGLAVNLIIIARIFYQTSIPEELYEAAIVDGSNDFGQFFKVAVPLSLPIIAVIALFYAVGRWNDFFTALIFVQKPKYYPLQMVLRSILIQNANAVDDSQMQIAGNSILTQQHLLATQRKKMMAEGMKYSLIFIASAPLLIAYPFVQKHFVKGVLIGSLKG